MDRIASVNGIVVLVIIMCKASGARKNVPEWRLINDVARNCSLYNGNSKSRDT